MAFLTGFQWKLRRRKRPHGNDRRVRQGERQAMLAAADDHWWYRGRRRIIRAELSDLALPPDARLLDAGCGSGQLLDLLSEFGTPTGVDPDSDCVARAAERGYDALQ